MIFSLQKRHKKIFHLKKSEKWMKVFCKGLHLQGIVEEKQQYLLFEAWKSNKLQPISGRWWNEMKVWSWNKNFPEHLLQCNEDSLSNHPESNLKNGVHVWKSTWRTSHRIFLIKTKSNRFVFAKYYIRIYPSLSVWHSLFMSLTLITEANLYKWDCTNIY